MLNSTPLGAISSHMPRLQTAYVQASGDEEPTSLLVRRGCKVGELQQFLYIQTGDPTTRPGDFYAHCVRLDARAPISTRQIYHFDWVESGSAIPRGGGCAGIQVLPEYTDILPNLFERGRLPVRCTYGAGPRLLLKSCCL